jgi:PAS domain S-box-containing protein
MNPFRNYSIKSGFNIINISVVVLIISILFFFIFSLNKIQKFNQYNNEINNLKEHHLNLRRFEQQFLNRYKDDEKYFVTGENTYIDKVKLESLNIRNLIDSLLANKITKRINIEQNLLKIKSINEDYINIFEELSEKIYKRGAFKTGIIGELKSTGEELDRYSENSTTVNEINSILDNYLLTYDENYYSRFLKLYNTLAPTVNITDVQIVNGDSTINDTEYNQMVSGSGFIPTLHRFKSQFTTLVHLNETIGLSYDKGFMENLRAKSHEFDDPFSFLSTIVDNNLKAAQQKTIRNSLIFLLIIVIIFIIFFKRFSDSIVNPLHKLTKYIEPLSQGILPDEEPVIKGNNEISVINSGIKNLVAGLKKVTAFAISIGQRKYKADFHPLSSKDELGNALLEMRENLMIANDEEVKRKIEDEIRTWQNTGLTKFNDILRQNQGNIKQMSTAVISELVKFIKANQGGFFVFNDEPEDRYLELTAAYAFGQERKKQKIIYPGEGIVGTVAVEKETVYITDVPESYITITSGLGGANPRCILIVPMIVEEEVIGVIELASFNNFEKHEIEFVEILSGTVASSLSITKINQRTAILLEQSQKQAEIMKVQEEEMRQNFEELQQVQEESSRRAAEMSSILAAIDASSPVFNLDINGKITSVNKQLLFMIDSADINLVGKYHKEFINYESEEEYAKFWQMLLNGQNIQKDEYIKIAEKEFWLSVVYRPIIDDSGKILYILSVATNLTDYKKLELELKEKIVELNNAQKETERKQSILQNTNEMLKANEKTLQSAVENAMKQRKELAKRVDEIAEIDAASASQLEGIKLTNLTIEFDLSATITSVNKIFESIFHFSEQEIISKKPDVFLHENYINSNDYKLLWENLLKGKNVSDTFEFKDKNNMNLFIRGTYTAIKDRNEKTEKVFFIGYDITELITKTKELEELKKNL